MIPESCGLKNSLEHYLSDHNADLTDVEHYFISRVVDLMVREEQPKSIEDELVACLYSCACGDESNLTMEEKILARDFYFKRFNTYNPPDAIVEDFMKREFVKLLSENFKKEGR